MSEGRQGAHGRRREAIRRKVQRRHMRFYKHCTNWTFAETAPDTAQPIRWHREHWVLAATAALLTLLSAVAMPGWANAMQRPQAKPELVALPLSLPALPPVDAVVAPQPQWETVTVQPGETLSDIFASQGLDYDTLKQALGATTDASVLRDIHPGDVFAFKIDAQGDLEAMRFDKDATHRVTLHFDADNATRTVKARPVQHREKIAHGVIESSLFAAGSKAGLSTAMVVKLADVFKYDINFITDIRKGDSFTVVYDAAYRNGSYLHAGDILAAEFTNRGHRYTAYRFTLPNGQTGYYSADGRPLHKALLRVPIKFTRISSRFGMRMDPVIHERHLHAGVDYAAPMGTPIHAAGNGVITVRGWVHGYGRYIRIKDNTHYSTYYGHMSRYQSGLHVGSRVQQGEVIGYVGQSGWATGPHLHYGVLLNGKPVNPLTVTLPKPKPLAPALLVQFRQHAAPLLAQMQHLDNYLQVAKAGTSAGVDAHAE